MRKRIKLSQNFLKSKKLVRKLIVNSSISKDDIVYEIGAGNGIITEKLIKYCRKVVAFEIDQNLYDKLNQKLKKYPERAELKQKNFIKHPLPKYKYKVFANIPFNITADIIKKLAFSSNPPEDSYLIIQKEASNKFVGRPLNSSNTLISILMKVDFQMEIFHKFDKSDFFPKPRVEIVMLRIRKKDKPLVSKRERASFYDFVTFTYSQFETNILKGLDKIMDEQTIRRIAKDIRFSVSSKPSQLEIGHWVALFEKFLQHSTKTQRNEVEGSFQELKIQQSRLQKIHRTRRDKNWKKSRTRQ